MAITQPACNTRRRAAWGRGIGLGVVLLLASCVHATPDDLTISTQVKIELLADPALGAGRLDVSTLNGIVRLAGTVRSQADADRAIAAAKRVGGVHAVTSDLKIAGG